MTSLDQKMNEELTVLRREWIERWTKRLEKETSLNIEEAREHARVAFEMYAAWRKVEP
jgi:hypothetical protein